MRVPLTEIDETRFTESSREMIESGNWVIPYCNYEPRYRKPIGFYWVQAAAMKTFGNNEVAARLPSAVSATALVLMMYGFLLGKLAGEAESKKRAGGAAFLASLALVVCPLVAVYARAAVTDHVLTLFITGALLSILNADLATDRKSIRRWYMLAGISAGLAFLTKGPQGLVIPGAVWFLYHASRRNLMNAAKSVPWASTIGLFVLVAAPWYVATYVVDGPAFLRWFFLRENVARYSSTMEGHGSNNPLRVFITPLMSILLMFPVSAYVLNELARPFGGATDAKTDTLARMRRFAIVWLVVVVGIFSISKTQLPQYVMSIIGACGVLFAINLLGRFSIENNRARWGETAIISIVGLGYGFLLLKVLQRGDATVKLPAMPFPQPITTIVLISGIVLALAVAVGAIVLGSMRKQSVAWTISVWSLFMAVFVLGVLPIWVRSAYMPSVRVGEYLRTLPKGVTVVSNTKKNSESLYYYAERRVESARQSDPKTLGKLRAMLQKTGKLAVVTDDHGAEGLKSLGRVAELRRFGKIVVVGVSK